jgi:VanZ family protein
MSRPRIWGLTLAWAVLLVALTVSPAPSSPLAPPVPGIDKLVHAVLFGVLTWLALQARERDRALRMPLWLLVAAIAVFAGVDEGMQQFVPGRAADVLDWTADVAGSLLAVWLFRSAPRRREMMS